MLKLPIYFFNFFSNYSVSWQAGTKRSDRFDLPKNWAFTFILRIFWQFHAVTAIRSRLP
jgi:hypothetical protein